MPEDRLTATDILVQAGELCAKCHVEFDGRHGVPVYCHSCHDEIKGKGMEPQLAKAWLEEKPK